MAAAAAGDRRDQRDLVPVREQMRVIDEVLVDRDAEAPAQLPDVRVSRRERRDRIANARTVRQLEVFFVFAQAFAKHGEVEDVDAHAGMISGTMTAELRELYTRIHRVIRKIPRGRVATYGQVAELAGIPGGARISAAALKTSTKADRLPWQRVIGKAGKLRGRIAIHDPVGAAIQRQLLADEGVEVSERGLIALDEYGWLPGPVATRRRRAHR